MSSRLRIIAGSLITAAVLGFTAAPTAASTPVDTSHARHSRAGDPQTDGILGNVVSGVPLVGSAVRGVASLLSLLPVVGEIVKPLTGDPLAGIRNGVKTLAILAALFPKKP